MIDRHGRCAGAGYAAVLAVCFAWSAFARAEDTPAGRWQNASMEQYRQHLTALEGLTQSCAKGRDVKSCDPTLVGLDDRIPFGNIASGERRMVRYGWLRVLFYHAESPDEKPEDGRDALPKGKSEPAARPAPRTTSQLLVDAETRLAGDLAQATGSNTNSMAEIQDGDRRFDRERAVMDQVLSEREFRNLKQPDERDTVLERVGNWLNHLFEGFGRLRARAAWVGRVLVWGFFLAVGIALTWGLLQVERRWRVRLVPLGESPAPAAASAREWQLWMADARRAAAAGLWREAIHFVYWASISRLESRRLWPADGARTPREYVSLVGPEDPRRGSLAELTARFERTWYGGREAGELEYRRAEEIAAALIAGGGATEGGAG